MMQFTLKLTDTDLDVLQIALIDHHAELSGAIRNERLCTNNEDTIASLWHDLIRIDSIREQLIKQMADRK
jgi:hypothetical protein